MPDNMNKIQELESQVEELKKREEDIRNKECRVCKFYSVCAGVHYMDAIRDRTYNIRDGKDCWTL